MEQLNSYYVRFWKRVGKDATPWARDNIIWGVVVLVAPLGAARLLHRQLHIDWELVYTTLSLYAFALLVYVAVHVCRGPKKLDNDREARENLLTEEISQHKATIQGFSVRAKRTPAEQNDYDTAKKAIGLLKDKGLIALRHIRKHGSLTFGTYSPVLPPGLTIADTLWVYNHCVGEGVLTQGGNVVMGERIYSIPPNMVKILDEVLYEGEITSVAQ